MVEAVALGDRPGQLVRGDRLPLEQELLRRLRGLARRLDGGVHGRPVGVAEVDDDVGEEAARSADAQRLGDAVGLPLVLGPQLGRQRPLVEGVAGVDGAQVAGAVGAVHGAGLGSRAAGRRIVRRRVGLRDQLDARGRHRVGVRWGLRGRLDDRGRLGLGSRRLGLRGLGLGLVHRDR